MGNAHPHIVPYQAFATADGHFILAVGNDDQFARLCQLLGRTEWTAADAFQTNKQRVQKRAELVPLLEPLLRAQTTAYWVAELEALGVPCGPINTIDQVFANEQVQARDMVIEVEHALAGKLQMVNNPVKLSETPITLDKPPPLLGEHTQQVLTEVLGLSVEQQEKLRALGVV